jgi:hypothetical protein
MTFPIAGAAGVDLGDGDRVSALLGLQHTVQATTATVVLCKRTSKS